MAEEIYVSVIMWDGCIDAIEAFEDSDKAESWLREQIRDAGDGGEEKIKTFSLHDLLKSIENTHIEGSSIYVLNLR